MAGPVARNLAVVMPDHKLNNPKPSQKWASARTGQAARGCEASIAFAGSGLLYDNLNVFGQPPVAPKHATRGKGQMPREIIVFCHIIIPDAPTCIATSSLVWASGIANDFGSVTC